MTTPLTATTFFVAGLDCPAEEQLIRKQLKDMPEIEHLEFNFIAEEVTIHHRLSAIDSLQQHIESLGMSVRIKGSAHLTKEGELPVSDVSWKIILLAAILALFSELASYFLDSERSSWTIIPALLAI
ncbi:TPA: cation transporter, partial [Legionella anisa]